MHAVRRLQWNPASPHGVPDVRHLPHRSSSCHVDAIMPSAGTEVRLSAGHIDNCLPEIPAANAVHKVLHFRAAVVGSTQAAGIFLAHLRVILAAWVAANACQ